MNNRNNRTFRICVGLITSLFMLNMTNHFSNFTMFEYVLSLFYCVGFSYFSKNNFTHFYGLILSCVIVGKVIIKAFNGLSLIPTIVDIFIAIILITYSLYKIRKTNR